MIENPIEMSLISKRKDARNLPSIIKESNYDYIINSIRSKTRNCNHIAEGYISNYSDKENYSKCISVLEAVKENCNDCLYTKLENSFINNIVPKSNNLDEIYSLIEESEVLNNSILESIKDYKVADRILNNYSKLDSKKDIDYIFRENTNIMEKCYTVADRINAYDMSINNKIAITLETILYGLYRNDIKHTRKEVLENVIDYFLSVNDTLSDLDMKKIQKTIKDTRMVSSLDCSDLKFLSEDTFLYTTLLEEASKEEVEKEVQELIKRMKKTKSKKEAHTLANKVATLILGSYIVVETLSFVTITVLANSIILMAYLVGLAPAVLIKKVIDTIDKGIIKTDKEVRARASKTKAELLSVQNKKMVKESLLIESEDYADSNDVKKALAAYKADQCKDVSKFKRIITKFYAKSPDQVIDDMPNILAWIRMGFVFSTVTFSPLVTVPLFIVDQFISLGFKRKEAERMVKVFKKERDKTERRSYNIQNSEKIDKYIKCLDTCIYKLESYRDSQYSEKELEKRYELEECASLFDNQIRLEDVNLTFIKNDIRKIDRQLSGNINVDLMESVLYEFYNNDKGIEFINPEGFIEVPIMVTENYDIAEVFTDRISESLGSDYIVTLEVVNGKYEVHAINKSHINLNESEQEEVDNCIPYDIRYLFDNVSNITGNIDYLNTLNPMGVNKFIKENFTKLMECPELTCRYVRNCKDIVDLREFSIMLDSYRDKYTDDYIKSTELNVAKDILFKESIQFNPSIELVMEAQSISGLYNIINEGINTSTIKTACLNMKKKVTNLSAKEKELSRTLDANVDVFTRNMQKTMISNRREAIIKGSLIPSFSKTIKTALVAGATFMVAPTLAVIGSIGALAMSKKLTRKERKAILDEIDVELKIVERQIQKAESDGNMKEYRHFLTYQRKLEREKMRIVYSLGPGGGKQMPNTKLAHLDKDNDD